MANIETREKTIDDCEVRCTPHKGRPGARLLARLIRHLGPALSAMRGLDVDLSKGIQNVEIAELAPAIGGLFNSLTPDEFDTLACEILSRCQVIAPGAEGKPVKFDLSKPTAIDDAFAGDLLLMFKTMAWALEVNFAGFFLGLARSAAAVEARAAEAKAALTPRPE